MAGSFVLRVGVDSGQRLVDFYRHTQRYTQTYRQTHNDTYTERFTMKREEEEKSQLCSH